MQNQLMSTVNGIWSETRMKLDQYGHQIHEVTGSGVGDAQDKLERIVHNGRDGLNKLELEAQLAWNKGLRASWKVRDTKLHHDDITKVKKNLRVRIVF